MKIKAIERSLDEVQPVKGAPPLRKRNLDSSAHPFQRVREYNRAKTAAKLERMFAKPFVAALEGHIDGIYASAKDPQAISCIATGSGDGQVVLWSLASRDALLRIKGHGQNTGVADLCFTQGSSSSMATSSKRGKKIWSDFDGNADVVSEDEEESTAAAVKRSSHLLTCSKDKTVKLWSAVDERPPLKVWSGKTGFNSISHHRTEDVFATASDQVHIWDHTKSEPIQALSYSSLPQFRSQRDASTFSGEQLTCVRFSPSETSILASTSADRSVCFYDLRTASPTHRATLDMRCNSLSWNPLQPPVLLLASENEDLYTFDIRNMSSATQVYKDHVGPVMSCDWSPTGREFVSGSYDRTVRLWDLGKGRSRDVYHTKRMQRVFTTQFTLDTKFVLSGSDDGNLRIWKAAASSSLHYQSSKEMAARQYRDALRKKFSALPEIARIERQRHLPKEIYGKSKIKKEMLGSVKRKEENRRAHHKKGEVLANPKAERRKTVLGED